MVRRLVILVCGVGLLVGTLAEPRTLSVVQGQSPMTYIRFVHAATTKSDMDIYANGAAVLASVHHASATDYVELPAGVYHFRAQAHGEPHTQIEVAAQLQPELNYTLVLNEDPKLSMLLSDDNTWPDANQVKLRLVNLTTDKRGSIALVGHSSQLTDQQLQLVVSERGVSKYLALSVSALPGQISDLDTPSQAILIDRKQLTGGTVYTLFVFSSGEALKVAISIDSRIPLLPTTGADLTDTQNVRGDWVDSEVLP